MLEFRRRQENYHSIHYKKRIISIRTPNVSHNMCIRNVPKTKMEHILSGGVLVLVIVDIVVIINGFWSALI